MDLHQGSLNQRDKTEIENKLVFAFTSNSHICELKCSVLTSLVSFSLEQLLQADLQSISTNNTPQAFPGHQDISEWGLGGLLGMGVHWSDRSSPVELSH
jgi:hypothetical protein